MKENRRMLSIARKINLHYWMKLLWAIVLINVLLLGFVCWDFCAQAEGSLPAGEIIRERTMGIWSGDGMESLGETESSSGEESSGEAESSGGAESSSGTESPDRMEPAEEWVSGEKGNQNGKAVCYVITGEADVYYFPVRERVMSLLPQAIVLLIIELLLLIEGFFDVRVVRRRLKPLNDLAKKAEELSSLAFETSSKFNNLEQAITNIRPEAPNAKIHVGDKDLRSLEVAINNLLERMRESYRQQNRFVSDASHELRTPIAVIQGYVNMLDRWGKDDPEILQEAIEAMKNESDHMKHLVEQLLFLARGDSGRQSVKPERFSMTDMMKEIWEEYRMIDPTHRYLLQAEPDLYYTGDPDMIKQSVRIFVDNAVKYADQGTIIRFGVRSQGNEILYFVEDEGIGMEQDEVLHMFERFYRSDTARNSRTGGTGLGLSIAKWIVDAHRGTIDVLSRTGIGTRIAVTLKR
ncbi:MAG: HAMP domain-containing histidine kinase [Lachnospiraceae bacterium]|nr:HAMP domain-containing histidine kinase [Lachnospiraceae bacterium]